MDWFLYDRNIGHERVKIVLANTFFKFKIKDTRTNSKGPGPTV